MLVVMVIFGILVLALAAVVAVLAVSNAKLWIELKAMKGSTHQFTVFNPNPDNREEFKKMQESLKGAVSGKVNALDDDDDLGDLESIQ